MGVWDQMGELRNSLLDAGLNPAELTVKTPTANEILAMQNQAEKYMAQQMAMALHGGIANMPMAQNASPHENAKSMLFSRLHGFNYGFVMKQDDFLLPHVSPAKVYVFFIHGDRVGHLEDDIAIFPSDQLITQIRLLWA